MLGVFLVHFGQRIGLSGYVRNLTDFGQHGVQLFFAISGFLMINSLDKCYTKRDVFNFYVKKLIRLLVLYYLIVLWFFVSETLVLKNTVKDEYGLYWLRYVFLLNGIVPSDTYLWSNIGITWTIPIFLIAYLITPLLYKTLKINNTIKLSFLFVLFFLVYIFKNKILGDWFPFLGYYYTFIGGMLAFKAIKENKSNIIIFECIALICILLSLNIYFKATISLLCIILIIASYNLSTPNKLIQNTVSTLDKYSYTIYLGHGIVFCSILDKIAINIYLKATIAIFGTIILTIALYHFYEKPVTKYLTKKLVKHK